MKKGKKGLVMVKLTRGVAKGTVKGLGKLGKGVVGGVGSELLSIFTLGLYRPPRRRW
jgi:hypothetical protein